MSTNKPRTLRMSHKKMVAAWLSLFILLSGCEQSDYENVVHNSDDQLAGEPVAFTISLSNTPEYNDPNSVSPASRSGEPLLSEWVGVNSFSMTRSSSEESGVPKIALMELFEDTVPASTRTRGVMPTGNYFRLIAFKKSGNDYVFQSVADYTSDGSSAPVLKQGKMVVPCNQTYRFVAYTFNNSTAMGTLPSKSFWNNTKITIPDMNNDFLTFDSGDQMVSGETCVLSVSFNHQLTKLTVKPVVEDIGDKSFNDCTGVYISQGGSSSAWTVGGASIDIKSENSASFSIPDNGTETVRMVPQGVSRPVSVHIGSIILGGVNTLSNITISSTESVDLLPGKSYTMTVTFSPPPPPPGIQLLASDINLGGAACTAQDKTDLSQLTWAEGNLESSDNSHPYDWGTSQSDYGYYYTWNSTYTGNTSTNGTDPCTKLDFFKYGRGWRTPSKNELAKLARCTDKQLVTNNGKNGMWFMNKTKGLFLLAAGARNGYEGSGTTATYAASTGGYYWSSDTLDSGYAYFLHFYSGSADVDYSLSRNETYGYAVRCVQGTKQ